MVVNKLFKCIVKKNSKLKQTMILLTYFAPLWDNNFFKIIYAILIIITVIVPYILADDKKNNYDRITLRILMVYLFHFW